MDLEYWSVTNYNSHGNYFAQRFIQNEIRRTRRISRRLSPGRSPLRGSRMHQVDCAPWSIDFGGGTALALSFMRNRPRTS